MHTLASPRQRHLGCSLRTAGERANPASCRMGPQRSGTPPASLKESARRLAFLCTMHTTPAPVPKCWMLLAELGFNERMKTYQRQPVHRSCTRNLLMLGPPGCREVDAHELSVASQWTRAMVMMKTPSEEGFTTIELCHMWISGKSGRLLLRLMHRGSRRGLEGQAATYSGRPCRSIPLATAGRPAGGEECRR
jgi:hypothetical protein